MMKRGREKGGHNERLSRLLSSILRHRAEDERLSIRSDGFVRLADLLSLGKMKRFTEQDVRDVVEKNDKQRFSLQEEEGGVWFIRANQGHSMKCVQTEQLLERLDVSKYSICVHGTYTEAWKQIEKTGLKRMSRNQIHFASGLPGEDGVISGMRKSCQVLIFLNLQAAAKAGLPLFISANGVILTPGFDIGDETGVVPTCLFDKVVDRKSGAVLFQGDASFVPEGSIWKPSVIVEQEATSSVKQKSQASTKAQKKLSFTLAKILKHTATKLGLDVAANGYVKVEELAAKVSEFKGWGDKEWEEMVQSAGDVFSATRDSNGSVTHLRANYGHSMSAVDPQTIGTPVQPEGLSTIFIGLGQKEWDEGVNVIRAILPKHLRLSNYVRFVESPPSTPLVLVVDVHKAAMQGIRFFRNLQGELFSCGVDVEIGGSSKEKGIPLDVCNLWNE